MSDGNGYASRHLENNDYYAKGERVTGEWRGRGAELLGLIGNVKIEDFESVRQGLDPRKGEFLRQRRSVDRLAIDGTRLARGRSLYDFTISAPKSVSVMAMVGGDERLTAAHRTAVEEAIREIERHAATRVRQDHANENRTTGNLVLAVYHHDASRELDPQLHTHAVAVNLTYDGVEGRWKALQATAIYERRAYLTEIYRNALAREVRALGYEIENQRNAEGRDVGFEIRGIPPELRAKFSQRSHQRDQAIQQFIESNGRQPSDNEVAVLVRESRAVKLAEISTAEVLHRQKERLTLLERGSLSNARREGRAIAPEMDSAKRSLNYATEHVFERRSVARDFDVLGEALRHGRGRIDSVELRGTLALQESVGTVFRSGSEIATSESLRREQFMIDAVNRGIGAFIPLAETQGIISDRLRAEQKEAVEFVLGSRDRVVNISGAAGTGKTAALDELRRALTTQGREVIAIGPTLSAVEELQKVGFREAHTVERLLQDTTTQLSVKGSVVIVDEAGMISTRQMVDIIRLAENCDARIILSGDTKQIQSVEAGDALRILETQSRMKSASLTEIQRQTRKDYREAIEELRTNPEKGFVKLDAIGGVMEVAWHERSQKVAEAYNATEGRSSLVVCAAHDEIERVTDAIRNQRKEMGRIGASTILSRHVSLTWTTAQKSDQRNFREGQLLEFHRAVQGIAKNETVEVVHAAEDRIIVRGRNGDRTLTGKQAKCFDVLEQRPIEVAAGDRLLLTANRRDSRFRITNGEIVTVSQIEHDGRIQLEDGRTLPADFRRFTHGYAVTAHRSQGKSVNSVIISADGMQKELFYVAASRGREHISVVTSDKTRLQQTVAQSMARKSASELARKSHRCLRPEGSRGMAAARELVKRAVRHISTRISKPIVQETRKERIYERGFSR